MTNNPKVISQTASVLSACKRMIEEDVGSLLIVHNKKLLGILTKTDIIEKVVLKNKNPLRVSVEDVMTKNFIFTSPDADISTAAKIMVDENIHRLPVIKGGELVGLITQKDLLKIEPAIMDLLVEKFAVNNFSTTSLDNIRGTCEICGNFSDLFNHEVGLVCSKCREGL